MEAKLLAAENEVRYRTPAAPVIGLNAEKYSQSSSSSSSRPQTAYASRLAGPDGNQFADEHELMADGEEEEEEGEMEYEEEEEGILEVHDDGDYLPEESDEDIDAYGVLEDSGASDSTLMRD
ncbi:hypothetical protein EON64_16395 [archaeon]|nr:MAG: hypothetical protein EON64_16395 [archaeon]